MDSTDFGLKKDRAWEIIWLHPETTIVHETRSMFVYSFIRSCVMIVIVLIFCDIFHAENESEMPRI